MGSSAGALRSAEDRKTSSKSRAIDKALSRDAISGSECGKTTIFKQMRILHLDGFTRDDAIGYRSIIHGNAMEALTQMIEAAAQLKLKHEIEVQEDISRFNEYKNRLKDLEDLAIPFSIGRCMERIWNSLSVQAAYERRFSFPILDSAKYFLDDISRLTEDLYVPSTQDILHCRFRTTGINEINFTYKKIEFKMVDVGGQRTERRKWIHCFDNVDMILFVASISDYDMQDPEDSTMNRMMQNFEIFRAICSSEFFRHASIVLFLNKYDIFLEKLASSPLKQCWKHYEGDNSSADATAYVQKQFRRCVKNKQKYFTFVTTATDTNNIELVFSSAVAHIVNENLKSTGLQE